jgi:branched-chain amino acid transport system permease protein
MNSTIALFLVQDGLVNGAIYALLAVCFVLLFAATRIIFIPQGDFVAFGGLTLAALERGVLPGSALLLLCLGGLCALVELAELRNRAPGRWLAWRLAFYLAFPAALWVVLRWLAPMDLPAWADIALTVAIVVPIGPCIYRLAYQPMRNASVLVLLISSVGVHWMMVGLGLLFFGAEGYRATPVWTATISLGPAMIPAQTGLLLTATLIALGMLTWFFRRTLAGKALEAAAVNARGAEMVGISVESAGRTAFALAAVIGTLCGILIAPITTLYYDSGFLIGLKGFVAAIVAGFVSYPGAVLSAFALGVIEAFSSFWASSFKEVIVFGLVVPFLLWRSLTNPHSEEH